MRNEWNGQQFEGKNVPRRGTCIMEYHSILESGVMLEYVASQDGSVANMSR